MFEPKDIDAYNKIEAPSSLKARILTDCKNTEKKRAKIITINNISRKLAPIAACFILMVAVFSFMRLNSNDMTLTYGGFNISSEGVAFDMQATSRKTDAIPQSSLQVTLPFTLYCEKETTVNANAGTVFMADENGEIIEPIDNRTVINGEVYLVWIFDFDEHSPELTINYGSMQSIYAVQISENSPMGYIYKKQ